MRRHFGTEFVEQRSPFLAVARCFAQPREQIAVAVVIGFQIGEDTCVGHVMLLGFHPKNPGLPRLFQLRAVFIPAIHSLSIAMPSSCAVARPSSGMAMPGSVDRMR